jgi:Ion channel
MAALMARIPDDFKPGAALLVGAFLLVFLVLMHGAGLHGILVLHKRGVRNIRLGEPYLLQAFLLFAWAIFLMLGLHVAGTVVWALGLLSLGLIPRVYDAIYFCANAYTTLGFGNVDLDVHWRNIAPIIGISGLFTFAWTTSALVTVVTAHGELIDQLEVKRERELQMRFTLLKDEWAAVQSELHGERLEKEKVRAQLAGASFFQLLGIWKDERVRVKELRRAKVAEIRELRRKEHEEEEKLGPVAPPENPNDGK